MSINVTHEVVDGVVEEVGDEQPVHDVGAQQHEHAERVRDRRRAFAQQGAAERGDFATLTTWKKEERNFYLSIQHYTNEKSEKIHK